MTFTRKIVKNGHIYLYEVRSYREKGRVRQAARYLGKEIEKDGKKVLHPPKDGHPVVQVLDSAGYVLYYTVVEEGFLFQYDVSLQQSSD